MCQRISLFHYIVWKYHIMEGSPKTKAFLSCGLKSKSDWYKETLNWTDSWKQTRIYFQHLFFAGLSGKIKKSIVLVNVKSIICGKAKEKENHPLANTLQERLVNISHISVQFFSSIYFANKRAVNPWSWAFVNLDIETVGFFFVMLGFCEFRHWGSWFFCDVRLLWLFL